MKYKPISPKVHALTDYALVTSLLTVPRLLRFNNKVKKIYTAEALLLLVYIALTDTPVALKPLIPFPIHGRIDPFNVSQFALQSFMKSFRKDKKVLFFNIIFTLIAGGVVALTNFNEEDTKSQLDFADTELLNVAYFEEGEANNPVILLLHGWPDDATTWNKIMPGLTAAGYYVIAPFLRGFGKTTFHNKSTNHTGNSGIHALDMIELMDELKIDSFSIVGHDWGANIAEAMAVGYPGRVKCIALLSTPPRLGGIATPLFKHAQLEWYHWFQATKRGQEAVRKDPVGFAHIIWENWSPKGWFTEDTFTTVSQSWINEDFVDITLHSYQSRWDEAEPDSKSKELENKIKSTKTLSLPALYIQGDEDGVNPPYTSENIYTKFTDFFNKIIIPGTGHFPSREAPDELCSHLLSFLNN